MENVTVGRIMITSLQKMPNREARARLRHELALSRDMLVENVDVVPRFILELPHLKHMAILTNLPPSGPKRDKALKLIATIMAYKTALSFVFALETRNPDTIHAVLVSPRLHLGALQTFERCNLNFGEMIFFNPEHTDRDIVELFPRGCHTLTREDEFEIRNFLNQNEAWPDTFMLEV